MPNMFDSPIAGQYINTYARLPFQEIAHMGDKLRKRSDETLQLISSNEDLLNMPVLKPDEETRNAAQSQFRSELEEISKLHASGEYDEAQRRARKLGSGVKTWTEQDAGFNMAKSYRTYNEDAKMFDSAVAKGLMTAEQAAWEKQDMLNKYKGITSGDYQSTLPTVIEKGLADQAIAGASGSGGWAADKNYNLIHTEDGAYYVNEKNEKVSEDEVKSAMTSYLKSKPENIAWANRQADFMMKNLDPSQDSFEVNGKTYTRDEFRNKIAQEKINEAADIAAKKVGYTSTEATLTADQMVFAAAKARATVKTAADAFVPTGTEFIKVTERNVDELLKANGNLKTLIKNQDVAINKYKASNPNASADKNDPNFDPVYHTLLADQELSNLQLAESESYLHAPKTKVRKDISNNTGAYQFLDYANPSRPKASHPSRGTTEYSNPIYGLSDKLIKDYSQGTGHKDLDEAIQEVQSGNPPKKLNQLLQKNIQDGKGFNQFLDEYGLSNLKLKRPSDDPILGELSNKYNSALKQYETDVVKSMRNDAKQVDSFRLIAAIDSGKHASADAILSNEVGKDIIATAGLGYSVPTGGQLDQYMKDLLGDSWSEEYANAWKGGKVVINQTSGMSASGKPILNMSITDSNGKRHNIPILSNSPDLYIKTAKSLASSQYPDSQMVGQDMIKNAAKVGQNNLGSIIKGARLENMFNDDDTPKEGVKSPLYGFKDGGKQMYVRPKKISGNGMRVYEIVNSDDKVLISNIGGSNDLRNVLYESLAKLNSGDENWKNLYGLGK